MCERTYVHHTRAHHTRAQIPHAALLLNSGADVWEGVLDACLMLGPKEDTSMWNLDLS